ncbi:nuclear pore complex protein Nup85, partial [Tremellales sp. Uapishka_1]
MPAPTPFSFSPVGQPYTSITKRPSFSSPFAPKTSTRLSQSVSADMFSSDSSSSPEDEMFRREEDVDVLHLEPYAFKKSERRKWKSSGRTIAFAVSPVGGEVASYVTQLDTAKEVEKASQTISDRTVYFSSPNVLSDPLIDLFTETYTLFTSLQRIVASSVSLDNVLQPPNSELISHMRRMTRMYGEEIARVKDGQGHEGGKFEAIGNVWKLMEILYLPVDGRGEGLVGEELLDWVNDVDRAPNNEQGNEIMQSKDCWEHPSFWPYINRYEFKLISKLLSHRHSRCLLRGFLLPASSFLRTLASHSNAQISKLSLLLSTHLSLFPRSTNTTAYPLDHQFLSAHKVWLARFRAELSTFTAGRPRGRWLGESSDLYGWEEDFRGVIDLMQGVEERVLDEAADWREALGAWGVLVEVGLRRDDLPEILARITDRIPVDTTILEDSIQSSLCSGDIVKALMGCHDLDIWLAAHLGDIFDKLVLIPDDEERFETSLRDYFLLEYTDLLQTNPKSSALWRIICDYLSAAGEEGRNQLKSYILHVGLGSTDDEGGEEAQYKHFMQIKDACVELKLEEEWKTISQVMADKLVRRGNLGMAATMSLQAEDGYALSRIAERILDSYITQGEEPFLNLVDTLPPTLLNEAPMALNELEEDYNQLPSPTSMFATRLAFLSEFRDYLLYMNQNARDRAAERLVSLLTTGIAPVGFWAVLLVESIVLLEDSEIYFSANDTFELLRVLEEVMSNATFAPEYLAQVNTYLQRVNEKQAAKEDSGRKLEQVRLALARNLARALVVGQEEG